MMLFPSHTFDEEFKNVFRLPGCQLGSSIGVQDQEGLKDVLETELE